MSIPQREEEILKFWQENKIFEKSLEKPARSGGGSDKEFVFYDGPPFATGLPHYGHILAGTIKDAIARYQTMKGFSVPRKWGWDCHGLPIENIAEKELGIKQKTDIEKLGIDKFNEFCRSKVSDYVDEWKKIIPRLGRWADMETPYKTMDLSYMESVWWVFKQLYDKGLVYEGYHSMHICTRCETTLSQQEVAEGYKDVKDLSATAKFELVDDPSTSSGQGPTFVLAWTTTPWTLIGNVALAVGANIKYVTVSYEGKNYIVAKERAGDIFKDKEINLGKEILGGELAGKSYKPLFDYYVGKGLENEQNGWKIYAADFVTTEDGTGVVHIAPAFGEDDLNLGKANNLPFIQHVGMDGKIKSEATEFASLSVKPQDDPSNNSGQAHQKTDIEVIKYLAGKELLFAKEKYEHSYPHCWRCDTPLINYAASSWFVGVTKIKEEALTLAKEINWSPAHIKEGRFGNWLEGARDWSISRQRFWASVMPIWKCNKCSETEVLGSVEDIKNRVPKSGNKYFVMRHGEAAQNVKNIISGDLEASKQYLLTEKGQKEAKTSAESIKDKNINLIIASDFHRTKQTAEKVAEVLGISHDSIIYDPRLREIQTGMDGQPSQNYHSYFSSLKEKFIKTPPDGENLNQLKQRVGDLLYEIDNRYKDYNVLLISHEYPIWMLSMVATGLDNDKAVEIKEKNDDFINTGEVRELEFYQLPHTTNYILDLHRPYVDEVKFPCSKCSGTMERIPDVLDTWFDSGSMPYGQVHYPFENKEKFDATFPADFIGEGVDQTRAWFYYLHVIATSVKNSIAFKNVIVNGIVLAEDGKKMSKRLKNYPDPMEVVEKYGADSLRHYLLSSPAVRAESLNFSEKGVQESNRKVISSIFNSLNFLKTYATGATSYQPSAVSSENILDKWILIRLNQVTQKVTESLEAYDLAGSSREFVDFFDDLSNWYVRRSRARFQHAEDENDYKNAVAVLTKVVLESAKLLAPFAPFTAEAVYQDLKTLGLETKESVHLEDWPKAKELAGDDEKIMADMIEARKMASVALEIRQREGMAVRQVSGSFSTTMSSLPEEYINMVAKEINVKEIKTGASENKLDTTITAELKQEGMSRELMRNIQELRKKVGLMPQDKVTLIVDSSDDGKKLLEKFAEEIKKVTKLNSIKFAEVTDGEEAKIDELVFKLKIEK